eukprot:scaffold229493_cov26-Tisochrysis_lutea.AAC.1
MRPIFTFTTLISSGERPPESRKIDRHKRQAGQGRLVPHRRHCTSWGGRRLFGGRRRLSGQVGRGPKESLDIQGRARK